MFYVSASVAIVRCYVTQIQSLLELPRLISDPDHLATRMSKTTGAFETPPVSMEIVNSYNNSVDKLAALVRQHSTERPFVKSIMLFALLRFICLVVAAVGFPFWALGVGVVMQFMLLPFSGVVGLLHLVLLSPGLFVPHYVVVMLLKPVMMMGGLPLWEFRISWNFIACFFLVDQMACLLCLFRTNGGRTEVFGWKRTLWSICYGFFNSKTYTLLVLLCVRGTTVPMTLYLVDAILGITSMVSKRCYQLLGHWSVHFYHQHRLGHLPRVYEHAHKFHHYLHDTTAFDAHIYGRFELISIMFQ